MCGDPLSHIWKMEEEDQEFKDILRYVVLTNQQKSIRQVNRESPGLIFLVGVN